MRERSRAKVVAVTGSTAKTSTKDILGALCAPARARRSSRRGARTTRSACRSTLCRLERGHRDRGRRDGHARPRPDRGALRDRAAGHRHRHERRAGAPRAARDGRARRPGEGRADREPPARRHGRRAGRRDATSSRTSTGTTSTSSASGTGATSASATSPHGVAARVCGSRPSAARSRSSSASPRGTTPPTRSPRWPPTTRSAFPLGKAQQGARHVELSRLRGEEVPLPGGGTLHQRLLQREPALDGRGARAPAATAPGTAARLQCSATWPSSAPGAPHYHREVGAAAARAGVEVLVAVGPLARDYVDRRARGPARPAGRPRSSRASPRSARVLQPGDCVLVKGSRAMGLEVIAEAVAVVPARA